MTKSEKYLACIREIEIRLERGGNLISDLGNVTAILKKRMNFFWVGFYFYHENHLVLGPFQGTPACVFLPTEKGVCGACAKKRETIIVGNVHEFQGHIACDPDSKSEIAVPVLDASGNLRAVLDVDNTTVDAFDSIDQDNLEKISEMIQSCWDGV
jgi:L-methionine (R)-S-oxide reductase